MLGGAALISEAMNRLWDDFFVRPISEFGRFTTFFLEGVKRCMVPMIDRRLLLRQMEFVGNRSLGIVVIAGTLVGVIFGLILGNIFRRFGTESLLGAATGISLTKEVAPVFCGFLVTARAGSAMAAEIGTMRVNEQIDAMRIMSVNPYSYLVAPRILAASLVMPLLNCVFVLVGSVAAYGVAVAFYDVDTGVFIEKMRWLVRPAYLTQGMQKSAVFGLLIASIGCFRGFYAGGGAKGVGKATTEAVVASLVAILIADFFVSYLQFDKFL
ncbi:MAG: ABC transporter permease [Deltaproteobacteria bacterium]|nr:ABC transporter permease [Deltaproteobacteria bacterium]